jgi:hypothetical protein
MEPDAEIDWVRFDHPDGLFSLSYPQDWPQISPISSGGAFACSAGDGSVLIEVVCFTRDIDGASGAGHLVDVIADGLVKYAGLVTDTSRRRVIARNSFPFGGAERCVDLLIAYLNQAESDAEISVDYFVIGTGHSALQVAMKTTTGLFASNLGRYERLLGTLSTPWMRATSPPDLSGGRSSGGGQLPRVEPYPGLDELFKAESAPKVSQFPWGCVLTVVILIAVISWLIFR